MRRTFSLALFIAGLGFLLADRAAGLAEPLPPILEPAPAPGGSAIRVRIGITADEGKVFQFSGQVARFPEKGKTAAKKEYADAIIGIDTGSHDSQISIKKLQTWGYTVPADQEYFFLPEVILHSTQLTPKLKDKEKGSNVHVKLTNVKCRVVAEVANGTEQILGTDLMLSFQEATGMSRGGAKLPRFGFTSRFFDMNELPTAFTRPGGGDEPSPEPPSEADPKFVNFLAPLRPMTAAVFAQAQVNGHNTVKQGGMMVPLNVVVSSGTNVGPNLLLSIGAARELGVEVDQTKATLKADRVTKTGGLVPTKINELRLRVGTGKDYKIQKDIVFKDIPAVVDTFESQPMVLMGPPFINMYLPDAVLVLSEQPRALKLYGRVDPERLQAPKEPGGKEPVPPKKP